MALYKAEFLLEAKPMSLGEYCLLHGWAVSEKQGKEEGVAITYLPGKEPGWWPKAIFEANCREIEVLEE